MPMFDVDFYIRHYNGTISIDAPTAREAQLIVERLDADRLEKYTSSFEVFVEDVSQADPGQTGQK